MAMMEEEFVRKRHWITEAEFLDRLAAASLIPGPSSTEVAIFIGQSKRGWAGLIVGGKNALACGFPCHRNRFGRGEKAMSFFNAKYYNLFFVCV